MKRVFISNLVLLVGLNLLVKPFYLLFVETEIQNRTGKENFGLYFALINFSFILNIIPDLGTTNHNTRMVAHDGEINSVQFRRMMFLRLTLAGIYLVIAFIAGALLQYSSEQLWMLGVLVFNQIISATILFLRSYLSGMHLFKQDSVVSILDRLLLTIMMIALLLGSSSNYFRIEWLIYGQTIAYVVTMLVAFFLVIKKTTDISVSHQVQPYSKILKESLPFASLILISMLGYRVDTVMLERMTGASEAGIYAMGFRFFEAINMVSYLFAVLLLPIFTRMISQKDDVSSLLQLGLKIIYTGTFIVSVAAIFYHSEILSLVYKSNIDEASIPFLFLMISSMFFSLQYVTGTLITATGKMRPMIVIATIGLVFNVMINTFIIPEYGASGCAVASCLTQGLIFIAQLIFVFRKHYSLAISPLVIRSVVFSISCLLIAFSLKYAGILTNYPIVLLMAFSFVCLVMAFITGMLQWRNINELFTRSKAIASEDSTIP